MLCIAALFVTMAFPAPALINPTGDAVTGVSLDFPTGYILLSPITRVLDQLTVLGVSQHVMTILTFLGLGLGLGVRIGSPRGGKRVLRGALGLSGGLAAALLVYSGVAYLPRPMPSLVVDNPNVIALNLHAHSLHSHDVSDRYPVEWTRAWHERAGYNAFVLSDHSNWTGVAEGLATNPATAGEGTLLLSGVEVWLTGEHIIALGDSTRYTGLLSPNRADFLPEYGDRLATPPTFVVTIPGDPFRLDPLEDAPLGVVAVEIHDGAPRGLEQGRLQRDSIIEWARAENLALVSAWNNHGAGQTPTAWTLMRLPGWQSMDAASLLAEVESTLHRERFEATRVVERPAPAGYNSLQLVLAAPATLLLVLRTITTPERLIWLLYLLGVWAVSSLSVRRRS